MTRMFEAGLPLGEPKPWVSGDTALAMRVRAVLETRPGQLPWRPDFGCDLDVLVGKSATADALSTARWHVEAALKRWLPEVTIERLEVRVVSMSGGRMANRGSAPFAEAAFALARRSGGASARIGTLRPGRARGADHHVGALMRSALSVEPTHARSGA